MRTRREILDDASERSDRNIRRIRILALAVQGLEVDASSVVDTRALLHAVEEIESDILEVDGAIDRLLEEEGGSETEEDNEADGGVQ